METVFAPHSELSISKRWELQMWFNKYMSLYDLMFDTILERLPTRKSQPNEENTNEMRLAVD